MGLSQVVVNTTHEMEISRHTLRLMHRITGSWKDLQSILRSVIVLWDLCHALQNDPQNTFDAIEALAITMRNLPFRSARYVGDSGVYDRPLYEI